MSMPFYVSPEQLMKDRADFARKGIARGRSVAVLQYADGIVFVSENPSQALHKVSEIYDRIAFAAVGRYNEFENLRIAGVRLADMRGYAYDRRDVTGRGLANAYAQTLGTIFSSGGEKPYEVEIFVAEVGDTVEDDQIYRLTYDGQVADEHGFAVMGGNTEAVTGHLRENYRPGSSLGEVLQPAVRALGQSDAGSRVIAAADLEVAVLDRTRSQQRKFKRLSAEHLASLLGERVGRRPAGTPPATRPTPQHRPDPQPRPGAAAGRAAGGASGEPAAAAAAAAERPGDAAGAPRRAPAGRPGRPAALIRPAGCASRLRGPCACT